MTRMFWHMQFLKINSYVNNFYPLAFKSITKKTQRTIL